ncbi:MAG: hypothetical protein J2P21_14255 [Chloracidobacterium sp.]|nr:hypothetical protein [Chloracidobacterium sp.]
MRNHTKQANIQTPETLADNLIGSLDGLTSIEGAELRRQVVMLINHSYALGYATGAGSGLISRMRSKLALALSGSGRDIQLALSAISKRLEMIFSDHQMLPLTFSIQTPMRAIPVRRFNGNRPTGLLIPASDQSGASYDQAA